MFFYVLQNKKEILCLALQRLQVQWLNGIIFVTLIQSIEHSWMIIIITIVWNDPLKEGLLYCFKHLLCAALEGECCYLLQMWKQYRNGLRIQAPVISGFTACTTNSYTHWVTQTTQRLKDAYRLGGKIKSTTSVRYIRDSSGVYQRANGATQGWFLADRPSRGGLFCDRFSEVIMHLATEGTPPLKAMHYHDR